MKAESRKRSSKRQEGASASAPAATAVMPSAVPLEITPPVGGLSLPIEMSRRFCRVLEQLSEDMAEWHDQWRDQRRRDIAAPLGLPPDLARALRSIASHLWSVRLHVGTARVVSKAREELSEILDHPERVAPPGSRRHDCALALCESLNRPLRQGPQEWKDTVKALECGEEALRPVRRELVLARSRLGGDVPRVAGIAGDCMHSAVLGLARWVFMTLPWGSFREGRDGEATKRDEQVLPGRLARVPEIDGSAVLSELTAEAITAAELRESSSGRPPFPISNADLGQPGSPDGLYPPNLFVWSGQRHEMPPRLWRLLDFMWTRDRATLEEVEEKVWDGESVQTGTVRSAASRLTRELLAVGCCMTVSVKSGYICKTSHVAN